MDWTRRRRVVLRLAAAILAAGAGTVVTLDRGVGVVHAQPGDVAHRKVAGLDVVQVRPNFYMIAGAGGNVGVQLGPDGVIVVDAGGASHADAVLEAIKTLSDQPIRFVISTTSDQDHAGGAGKVATAGQTLFNLDNNPSRVTMTGGGAAIVIATENAMQRMSTAAPGVTPLPDTLPTEPFFENRKVMYFNGEGIEILAQPSAHSDGDAMVFFRRSDVVVAGPVLDTTRFPVIDVANGGSVQGVVDALNRLVDLAIPSVPFDWRDDGTVVIPARGRVCDQVDVADYRDMVTVVRDRVAALLKEGKSLSEIQAANPTQGFTRRYGSDAGSWTTAMFVEAVYKSLAQEGTR